MMTDSNLPDDIDALKAMILASQAEIAHRDMLVADLDAVIERKEDCIQRLEKLVADFKRALFGARSEKANPEQYELALEDVETAMAAVHAEDEALDPPTSRATKHAIRIAERCPSICPVLKRLLRLTARSAAAVPSAM